MVIGESRGDFYGDMTLIALDCLSLRVLPAYLVSRKELKEEANSFYYCPNHRYLVQLPERLHFIWKRPEFSPTRSLLVISCQNNGC